MTNEMLQEYQAFMSKVNEKLNADQELEEAWEKVSTLLEGTEALGGGSYGGLEDMIRSHFDGLSDCSRPSISFVRDADHELGHDQKGCIVLRVEPDAHEERDFKLVEEASYPYVEVDGNTYISVALLDTILDCTRRGYLIDAKTIVISDEDMEKEAPAWTLPRHHGPRKRKSNKRRK